MATNEALALNLARTAYPPPTLTDEEYARWAKEVAFADGLTAAGHEVTVDEYQQLQQYINTLLTPGGMPTSGDGRRIAAYEGLTTRLQVAKLFIDIIRAYGERETVEITPLAVQDFAERASDMHRHLGATRFGDDVLPIGYAVRCRQEMQFVDRYVGLLRTHTRSA